MVPARRFAAKGGNILGMCALLALITEKIAGQSELSRRVREPSLHLDGLMAD
jgi:hypothetical protein